MITLAISLIKIMKCYCTRLSCGWGGIMYTCHQEVTSRHGVHISILTQPGGPGDVVCDGMVPSFSLRHTGSAPLSHTPSCWSDNDKSSCYSFGLQLEPSGWLGLTPPTGRPPELPTKLYGGDKPWSVLSPPLATPTSKGEGDRNASDLLGHRP